MARSSEDYGATGACARFWKPFSVRDGHSQPGNPHSKGELPSEHTSITPEKAKLMLHEGTARGHKLTHKQKGFLGAVAGKGD
jgi:hypothetical protein